MDKLARNIGFRRMTKPDWDYCMYQDQTGEWSEKRCEEFEKHLIRLAQGLDYGLLWYGKEGMPV